MMRFVVGIEAMTSDEMTDGIGLLIINGIEEGIPSGFIGQLRIRAAFDEKVNDGVVAPLGGNEQ